MIFQTILKAKKPDEFMIGISGVKKKDLRFELRYSTIIKPLSVEHSEDLDGNNFFDNLPNDSSVHFLSLECFLL